ncbi:MAG TPA: hypothetical protein VF874_06485 [Mycobacterium sp.]
MLRPASSLAVALVAATLLTSCSAPIEGTPVIGPKDVDQSFFFAGDVPVYGQQLSADDISYLAYLRALRRVDVCGLISTSANIGELVSVGTLFAFDECDAELKVSGVSERRFVSVELEMSATAPSGCQALVPLPLSGLPAAPPLPEWMQPSVRVEPIGAQDCELTRRIAGALAQRLASKPLPPRDAAATYPARLAERDPCEVLSVVKNVTRWDVPGSGPYQCKFSTVDVGIEVGLQPQLIDAGPAPCSAVSFVGAPMQRRVIGVGYVDPTDVVIRPAVVVEADDCQMAADVATKAAKLYG